MNKLILVLALSAFIFTVSCSNCIGAQIYDSVTNTCLSSKSDCAGYISSDQFNCVTECQPNESVYEHVVEGLIQFKQCFFCEQGLVFNFIKPTQLYTCNDKCFQSYETADQNKICRCNKKIIFDLSNYQYLCSDTCRVNTYFMQKISQQGIYQCVPYCNSNNGYVQLENTQICIPKSECTTYIFNNKCVSSCDGVFIYEKVNNQNYQKCDGVCNLFSLISDNNARFCVSNCPEGYYKTQNQCILKKECTNGYISYDGKKCLNRCTDDTYPVALSENLFQCQICHEYLLIDKSQVLKCVDQCPPGFIRSDSKKKLCILLEYCEILSSDRSLCVTNCHYPDLYINGECVNPCKGKSSDCVPECQQGYFKQTNRYGFECVKDCTKYISTDQKYCLSNCNFVNEITPQTSQGSCLACKSQEIAQYNIQNNRLECYSVNFLSLEEQLKNFDITVEQYNINFQLLKNYVEQIKQFYQQIISQKDTSKIIGQLQLLVEIAEKILVIQDKQDNFTIDNSDKSFLLKLELPMIGYEHKKSLDVTQFYSDPSYSQFKPTANIVQQDSTTQNVYSILSINNPFCNSEKCKFSKLFLTRVHSPLFRYLQSENGSLPYQITFPVDKSISELNKLICISYNNFGEMYTNLEWTKFNQDKTSVSCSYASNTALFIDSTCLFIDQSLCIKIEEQKPEEEEKEQEQEKEGKEDNDDSISLSGGAIAGIVLGCVFGSLIIAFLVYKLVLQRILLQNSKQQRNFQTISPELNKQV